MNLIIHLHNRDHAESLNQYRYPFNQGNVLNQEIEYTQNASLKWRWLCRRWFQFIEF